MLRGNTRYACCREISISCHVRSGSGCRYSGSMRIRSRDSRPVAWRAALTPASGWHSARSASSWGPSTGTAGGSEPTKPIAISQSSPVGFTTRRTVRGELVGSHLDQFHADHLRRPAEIGELGLEARECEENGGSRRRALPERTIYESGVVPGGYRTTVVPRGFTSRLEPALSYGFGTRRSSTRMRDDIALLVFPARVTPCRTEILV